MGGVFLLRSKHWTFWSQKRRKKEVRLSAPRGGQTAAILASLTSTCRRHQIDPQRYFTQLLVNLPQTKMSDLPNWLPEQWKLGHTQS
jgi:hypothetical protein